MPLLAVCGKKTDSKIKETILSDSAEKDVASHFDEQEFLFLNETEEIDFDPSWKIDDNQIFVIPIPSNDDTFRELQADRLEREPVIDRELGEIRGFATKSKNVKNRLLVQTFSSRRLLIQPKILTLRYEANAFTRLRRPGFQLDSELTCIVEDDVIKFKSLHKLGGIIDTSEIFSVATDSEIHDFVGNCTHLFHDFDADEFLSNTDRNARKNISLLNQTMVLNDHTTDTIRDAAVEARHSLSFADDGKIEMPTKKSEITGLMRFLNDGQYVGPISKNTFITNSRRRVQSV